MTLNVKKYSRTKTSRKPRARTVRRYHKRKMRVAPRTMDYTKPMPLQYNCKFKYVQQTQLYTTPLVGVNVNLFLLNSLFDPDFTGVGHQPYGFDQITLFYRKYRVNAVKVNIRCFNPSVNGMRFGYKIRASADGYSTNLASATQIRETPNSGQKVVNKDKGATGFISVYVPLHRIQGVSKLKYAIDDGFSATTATNPVKSIFMDVWLSSFIENQLGDTAYITVEFIYYATLYQLITQNPSA